MAPSSPFLLVLATTLALLLFSVPIAAHRSPVAHLSHLNAHRRHQHGGSSSGHPPSAFARRASSSSSSAKVVVGTGLASQFEANNTAISSVFLLPAGEDDGVDVQGSARVPNTWSFSIAFDRSTFVSPSSSFVSYSAALSSGGSLPSWLKFNAYGIYFYGNAPSSDGTYDVELCGGRWEGGKDVCQTFEVVVDRSPRTGEVRSGSSTTASASATASVSASSSTSAAVPTQTVDVTLQRVNVTAQTGTEVVWNLTTVEGASLLDSTGWGSDTTVVVDCSSVDGLEWDQSSRSFIGNISTSGITDSTYPTAASFNTSTSSLVLPVTITPSPFASSNTSSSTTANSTLSLQLPFSIYPSLFSNSDFDPAKNATVGQEFEVDLVANLNEAVQAGSMVEMRVAFEPVEASSWLFFNRTSGVVSTSSTSSASARKRAEEGGEGTVPDGLAYSTVQITLAATDSLTSAVSNERTTINVSPSSSSNGAGSTSSGGGGGLSKQGRTILGAVLGSVLGALVLLLLLWLCCRRRRKTQQASQQQRNEKAAVKEGGGVWFDPEDEDDEVDLRDPDDHNRLLHQQDGSYQPTISHPLPPPPAIVPPVKRSSTTTLSRFRDLIGRRDSTVPAEQPRGVMVSTHKASLSSSRAGIARPLTVELASPRPSDVSAYSTNHAYNHGREEMGELSSSDDHARANTPFYSAHERPSVISSPTVDEHSHGRRSSVSSMDQPSAPPTPGRPGFAGVMQRSLFPFLHRDPAIRGQARQPPAAGGQEGGEGGQPRSGHQTHQSLASWESASTYDWGHPTPDSPRNLQSTTFTDGTHGPTGGGGSAGGKESGSSGSFPSQYSDAARSRSLGGLGSGAFRDEEETPAGTLPLSLTQGTLPDLGPVLLSRAERVPSTQAVRVRVSNGSAHLPSPTNEVVPDSNTVRHSVPPASQSVQAFAHPHLPFVPADHDTVDTNYVTYVTQLSSDGSIAQTGAPSRRTDDQASELHTTRTPADVADFTASTDDTSDDGHDTHTFGSYDSSDDARRAGGGGLGQDDSNEDAALSPLSSLAQRTNSIRKASGSRAPPPATTAFGVAHSALTPPRALANDSMSSGSPKLSFRTSVDSMSLVYFAHVDEPFSFRPVDDAGAASRGGVLRAIQTGPEGKGEKALPRWLTFDRGMFEGIPTEADEGRIDLKITETGPSVETGMLEERIAGHFSLEVRPSSLIPRRSTRAGNPSTTPRVVSSSGLIGQWR